MAGLEDSREGVRKICKDNFKMEDVIQIAAVVSSWEVAALQKTKEDESKAMSKASNMTRPVTEPEHTKFVNALEVKAGREMEEHTKWQQQLNDCGAHGSEHEASR